MYNPGGKFLLSILRYKNTEFNWNSGSVNLLLGITCWSASCDEICQSAFEKDGKRWLKHSFKSV